LEIQEATWLGPLLEKLWAVPSEDALAMKLEIQEATWLEPLLENQWAMPSEDALGM
jgi:hypothetical protein